MLCGSSGERSVVYCLLQGVSDSAHIISSSALLSIGGRWLVTTGAHGVNSSMMLLLLHPHSKSGYYEDQEIKRIRREAQDGCSGTEVGHGMLESHMAIEKKV